MEDAALALGGRLERVDPGVLCPLISETLFFNPAVVDCIEVAVAGREPDATGGCGKELMLIVLRTVFSGRVDVDFESDEADLSVGMLGDDAECWVVGNADGRGLEGIRSFGGLCGSVLILGRPVGTGRLFLGGLFAVGMGGRADVGGPIAGGDSCGREDAIVVDITLSVLPRFGPTQQDMMSGCPARQIVIRPRYIVLACESPIKSYVLLLSMCAVFESMAEVP
jgi:hypothetical protein